MAKLYRIFLMFALVAMLLTACHVAEPASSATNTEASQPSSPSTLQPVTTAPMPTQTTAVPTPPNASATGVPCKLAARILRWNYFPKDIQLPMIFKSSAQLESWLERYLKRSTVSSTAQYDDEFFRENSLILVCFHAQPGYSTVIVRNCLKKQDGSYSITLTEPGPTFSDGFSYIMYVFLEIADDVPQDAEITINFEDSENMVLLK